MDIVRLRIPHEFIRGRTRLSWRDVHFGLSNELLDPVACVDLAVEQVAKLEHPSAALLDLAGAGSDAPTLRLVEGLADVEPMGNEKEIRDKWLYLALSWIYEHRDDYPDPLQRVEEVYADFGYPEEVAKFVRYMPMDGPDPGSREAAEQRLFERWKHYIDETEPSYRV